MMKKISSRSFKDSKVKQRRKWERGRGGEGRGGVERERGWRLTDL